MRPSEDLITNENFVDRVRTFYNSIKTKHNLARSEAIEMFNYFNTIYNSKERNYGCGSCAIRVFTSLGKFLKLAEDKQKEKLEKAELTKTIEASNTQEIIKKASIEVKKNKLSKNDNT